MSDITTQVRTFRSVIVKHLLDGGCEPVMAAEIAKEAFVTAMQSTVQRLTQEERAAYLCAIADRLLVARRMLSGHGEQAAVVQSQGELPPVVVPVNLAVQVTRESAPMAALPNSLNQAPVG